MKKFHMVVQHKDVRLALNHLQELGTVHVEHMHAPGGRIVQEHREEVANLARVLAAFKEMAHVCPQEKIANCQPVVERIVRLLTNKSILEEDIAKRQTLIHRWEPWGNFDPQDIERLRNHGVFLRLCERPLKGAPAVPADVIIEPVFKLEGNEYCVAISKGTVSLPYTEIALPETSLQDMKALQKQELDYLEKANAEIKEDCQFEACLKEALVKAEERLGFEETVVGMKEEGRLAVLKGYCPVDGCKDVETYAAKEGWAILIEEPDEDDNVPTLLRNPAWVNLSKPALNVIEILPGYNEVDVSPVFLIFFTLFFGILIGDAAYGAIFFLLTVFAQMKLRARVKDKKPFFLMYLLSGFTILWGVLTGTYFGQQWLPSSMNPVIPWLNETDNIQWLCFTIALIHLSLARLWRASLKFPHLTALAEIGWMLIIWGMYNLANMFVLNRAFPTFAIWFFIIGIPLAFFFMVPFKDFLKKVPQEMIPFVLSVISAGTDIISYIRLFAVGLATVAVADAANTMPAALPAFGIGYIFTVFLHLLNLILAAMAILVHAIRLNVLEFSGHLGLEWTGRKYSPFKKTLVKV